MKEPDCHFPLAWISDCFRDQRQIRERVSIVGTQVAVVRPVADDMLRVVQQTLGIDSQIDEKEKRTGKHGFHNERIDQSNKIDKKPNLKKKNSIKGEK